MNLDQLTDEILSRCDVLGACSDEAGRLSRPFLGPATRQAQDFVTSWMTDAGLSARRDAVGNLIGRKTGTGGRVFLIGSHIDTVPDAGKYDGPLGVMLGIAAAKYLRNRTFAKLLDVIAFSEEEGVRFCTPYLGSSAICGTFDSKWLSLKDINGISLEQSLKDFGLDKTELANAAYPPGQVSGYLEAHIEQGPVLESKDLSLGIVTAIVGQSRVWLRFAGQAGHAGTQPMEHRRDALAAAAGFIVAVEDTARGTEGLRATVGCITVEPNAGNVVPGVARLSLDVRHADDDLRHAMLDELLLNARRIAAARGIDVTVQPVMDQPAVPCDESLAQRLETAVNAAGHAVHRLPSGAGHDAVVLAKLCPVAMLFIQSPGGISHHPAESVRREDVRAALDVMIRFLESELVS